MFSGEVIRDDPVLLSKSTDNYQITIYYTFVVTVDDGLDDGEVGPSSIGDCFFGGVEVLAEHPGGDAVLVVVEVEDPLETDCLSGHLS